MATVVTLDFVDSKSGKITFTPPSSYVAATGWGNCQTGQDVILAKKWRAYFNFNTAGLPDTALVSKVEFLIRKNSAQPGGSPEIYYLKFSIGTFIGTALDGTPTEYAAGTLMVTLTAPPTDGTWLDLAQDAYNPCPYVNLTGDTDIKVWDDSIQGAGDSYWGLNFNQSKAKCKLRITYTVPSATATGRGTASAAGKVTAAGRATATGRGTAQGTATVRVVGASTVTGRGTAQLTTVVTALATVAATGRGTAQVAAVVGSSGSAKATGRGSVEIVAFVVVPGGGVATGRGDAGATAFVESFASASATGCGTAFCDAHVTERTASATATGYGWAWCRLTEVHFDPLARHSGTRTVRVRNAGTLSVPHAHAAVQRCATEDERLCGARRLN